MTKLPMSNDADVSAEGGRFNTALAAAITLRIPEMVTMLRGIEHYLTCVLLVPLLRRKQAMGMSSHHAI